MPRMIQFLLGQYAIRHASGSAPLRIVTPRANASTDRFAQVGTVLSLIVRMWRPWRRRAQERQLAGQVTDRDLADMALTRGDLYREFARPFWRADRTESGHQPSGSVGTLHSA